MPAAKCKGVQAAHATHRENVSRDRPWELPAAGLLYGLVMTSKAVPPPTEWETFEVRGRRYFWFPVRFRDGDEIAFTIARQLADRYEIRDVLARGGDGLILEAVDLRTGGRVLVKGLVWHKAVRAHLNEPIEEFIEQVRRARHHLQTERRLLVQLRRRGSNAVPHPNDYVFDANPMLEGPHFTLEDEEWRFDDWTLIDSEPYLVLERVSGTSLQDLLEHREGEPLDEWLAVRIIDQAATVLELLNEPLHMSNGQTWQLVYQDMKPGNLLVDARGRVTVLDFGGCQLVIDGTLVLHGAHSAGYCAPECGPENPEPIPLSADCYGLGSTLFHMLSGVNPRHLLPKDYREHGMRAARLDAQLLEGHCSKQLAEVVARAVAWEPEERFQTVAELRRALAEVI